MSTSKGEDHYVVKKSGMTEAKVREIRKAYANPCEHCGGRPTMEHLAAKYGITRVAIYNIIRRISWKHVA